MKKQGSKKKKIIKILLYFLGLIGLTLPFLLYAFLLLPRDIISGIVYEPITLENIRTIAILATSKQKKKKKCLASLKVHTPLTIDSSYTAYRYFSSSERNAFVYMGCLHKTTGENVYFVDESGRMFYTSVVSFLDKDDGDLYYTFISDEESVPLQINWTAKGGKRLPEFYWIEIKSSNILEKIWLWKRFKSNFKDERYTYPYIRKNYFAWRDEVLLFRDFKKRDLEGKNFSRQVLIFADLEEANLENTNLYRADLAGANLKNAVLKNADLRHATFGGANLSGANLSGAKFAVTHFFIANLAGANLQKTDLKSSYLMMANLKNANLFQSTLLDVTLNAANLQEANLKEAFLHRAFLQKANLLKANLEAANLNSATLYRANLEKANLNTTNLEQANLKEAFLRKAYLRKANLFKAELELANLNAADLYRANLEKANLNAANLAEASLRRANLNHAKLVQSNFQETDFREVENLTAEQLSQCASLENAKGLSKRMLEELKRMKPELVEWWNGGKWDERKGKYVTE